MTPPIAARTIGLGGFLLILGCYVTGCGNTKDNTEIVVTVWSDLVVPSEMDAIRIRVAGKQQTIDHPFQLTHAKDPGKYTIPVQLGLVPAGANDLPLSISAIGSSMGTDMVWQQASLPFIPGQAHELVLYLARSCRNIPCGDSPGFTCENGACTRPIPVDTAALPPYVPGGVTAPADAATASPSDAVAQDTPSDNTGASDVQGADAGPAPLDQGSKTTDGSNDRDGSPDAARIDVRADPDAALTDIDAPAKDPGATDSAATGGTTGAGGTGGAYGGGTGGNAVAGERGAFTATDRIDLGTIVVSTSQPVVVQIAPSLSVGTVSCLASSADLALVTRTCPTEGATSQPCTFTFSFHAAATGNKTETIVCSADGRTTQTSVVATVVSAPSLSANPSSPMFVAAIGDSDRVTISIANSGGATTGNLTATLSAGIAEFSIASNECIVPLAPLGVCKIDIVFRPTTPGAKTGILTVTDGRYDSALATASLTGTALAPAQVVVTPSPLDFGTVVVGRKNRSVLTVSNIGGMATDSLALTTNDPQFVISGNLCSGTSLPATSGKCTLTVTFSPVSVGAVRTLLNVGKASSGTLATATLTGIGQPAPTDANLVGSPASLDFGVTVVGAAVGPYVFTITNQGQTSSGSLAVVREDTTSSVGGATQFPFNTTCVGALAPGEYCSVGVTYSPTVAGSAAAAFRVTDGTASAKMTAVGIALQPAQLSLTCVSSTFDDTIVGQTSPSVVCTIRNGASAGAGQDTGAITAMVSDDFTMVSSGCGASLQPGSSCTLSLAFAPTARGTRYGTLTVNSANGGAANQQISGTGLAVVEVVSGGGNYAFGVVPVGATSANVATLDVYVRGQVGNLAVSGTDLKMLGGGGLANFSQQAGSDSPPDCASVTTTTPTVSKTTPFCRVRVAFTPQTKGAKTTTVTATGENGSTDSANLVGTASGSQTIAPSPMSFGPVSVGSQSTAYTLTVWNHAATAATDLAFQIAGPSASDFIGDAGQLTGQTLAAGAQGFVSVRFAPQSAGAKNATATVMAVVAGSAEFATATLTGTGVAH
jgi:hypothetical protein